MPSTSNHIAGDNEWDARILSNLLDYHAGTIGIDDQPLPAANMDVIDALLDTIDVPLTYHDEGRLEGAAAKIGDAP